jgi:hypothetical protein
MWDKFGSRKYYINFHTISSNNFQNEYFPGLRLILFNQDFPPFIFFKHKFLPHICPKYVYLPYFCGQFQTQR